MFITGIEEIINVWSNDAHKLAVFINIFYLPFLIYTFYSLLKISRKRKDFFQKDKNNSLKIINSIETVFIIIIVLNVLSCVGIGQLILNEIIDLILRAIGLILLFHGYFLSTLFYHMNDKNENYYYNNKKKEYSKNIFYYYIRYPDYLFLIMITLGFSFTSINILCFILTCFIIIPLIINRIKKEEKYIEKIDYDYLNYKKETRMLIPSIKKIIIDIKKISKINSEG